MLKKQEILKKIKRYAKEIGKTPSEKQFYEHAEIGIHDLKKYGWANYGELVYEAGLTPNKFDKTKYSYNQLCKFFIETIREKNKWPTRGYLDVKHNKNFNFPGSSTFYNKLGLTGELAQTILEFVEDKKDCDNIIEICNSVIKKYKDQDKSSRGAVDGFVYLGKQYGVYKIGRTNDLSRRQEELSTQAPEPMTYIHEIKTDDMKGVENYWHNKFKSKKSKKGKKLRGEWFNLNSSDVKAFKRWKNIC